MTAQRWKVAAIVAVWVALVAGWFLSLRGSGTSVGEAAQELVDRGRGAWWAFAAYLVVAVVRPLVLFPATLVTIAAGMLFGPWWGTLAAVIGANLSALAAYSVARSLRSATAGHADDERTVRAWVGRLRDNTFEAVLLMRLVFLPYDAVNYGCGLLRVERTPFLAATALGTLPGTVAFVLIGVSVERLDDGVRGVNGTVLLVSVAIVVVSIVAARLLRRRAPAAVVE